VELERVQDRLLLGMVAVAVVVETVRQAEMEVLVL
jgi:hypothetical protein